MLPSQTPLLPRQDLPFTGYPLCWDPRKMLHVHRFPLIFIRTCRRCHPPSHCPGSGSNPNLSFYPKWAACAPGVTSSFCANTKSVKVIPWYTWKVWHLQEGEIKVNNNNNYPYCAVTTVLNSDPTQFSQPPREISSIMISALWTRRQGLRVGTESRSFVCMYFLMHCMWLSKLYRFWNMTPGQGGKITGRWKWKGSW